VAATDLLPQVKKNFDAKKTCEFFFSSQRSFLIDFSSYSPQGGLHYDGHEEDVHARFPFSWCRRLWPQPPTIQGGVGEGQTLGRAIPLTFSHPMIRSAHRKRWMRTNKSSTTKIPMKRARTSPQNRHKRYSLPRYLSCRLTTSQRPSEFTQQLAASPTRPSQPFPSFFILIFRSLFIRFSSPRLHLPNAPSQSSKPMDGGSRRITRGTLTYQLRFDLLTFFLRSLTSRYGITDGPPFNQSFSSRFLHIIAPRWLKKGLNVKPIHVGRHLLSSISSATQDRLRQIMHRNERIER
jgi:hypothetical protein